MVAELLPELVDKVVEAPKDRVTKLFDVRPQLNGILIQEPLNCDLVIIAKLNSCRSTQYVLAFHLQDLADETALLFCRQ